MSPAVSLGITRWSSSSVLDFALLSLADTAWSNKATTSSSWSTADCATKASRIG